MNRTAIASIACFVTLLGTSYAIARPARNVHAVSEYATREASNAISSREDGAVMQPGETRKVHKVVIKEGTLKLWTCGKPQPSSFGGTYRTCEWK